MTAVRFKKDGQGKIVPVKLGGNYDPKSKCFSFYSDSFSYYSIMQAAELTRITLHVDKPTIVVNDISKTIDVPPAIINNRTMVPLRLIGENLDARVEWIAETSSVLVMHKEKELRLVIGQTGPGLDSPPIIVNNRTLVPLRYISENLGASVHWIPSTRSVEIVK